MPATRPVLQVFVAEHCSNCEEARRIAREAQAHFTDLRVEVVDLDVSGTVIPPEVFATPTYLLDGKVVSLGNPSLEKLSDRLAGYLESRGWNGSTTPRDSAGAKTERGR